MDDDTLMLEARKGNKAAMELIVLRHYDEVYAYAARRTGSAQEARDIAQLTFEKLVRALPAYRPLGRFRPWLFTIASNEISDHFRRRAPEGPLPEEMCGEGDTVRLLVKKEEYGLVRRSVLALPPSQQEAVILFYYHDMRLKDIARVTGANVNTVKSRLRLGLEKLRDTLEAECDERQMV